MEETFAAKVGERVPARVAIHAGNGLPARASAAIAAAWEGLEEHFEYHAALVARFKDACRASARRMWESGINEVGERLTPFERDACGALLRVVWHLAARIASHVCSHGARASIHSSAFTLPRSSSVIAYDHVQSIVDQPKLNAGMRRPRMPVDVGQGFLDETKDRPPYRER